jgi:hypothetical protein
MLTVYYGVSTIFNGISLYKKGDKFIGILHITMGVLSTISGLFGIASYWIVALSTVVLVIGVFAILVGLLIWYFSEDDLTVYLREMKT